MHLNFRSLSLHLVPVLFVWVFSFMWISLLPSYHSIDRGGRVVGGSVKPVLNNSVALNEFVMEYGYVPLSLRELQVYSRFKRKPFFIYDETANRIDYHPLTAKEWVLRSFGDDGDRSSLLGPRDYVRSSSAVRKRKGVRYRGSEVEHLFPAVLSQGSWSQNYVLLAHIYEHPYLGTRKLVVTQPENQHQVWVAPHPFVEEFYWLDGFKKLVYSAGNFAPRTAGLYIWNLKNNRAEKLRVPTESSLEGEASKSGTMLYTLTGVNPIEKTFMVRARRLHESFVNMSSFWKNSDYLFEYNYQENIWKRAPYSFLVGHMYQPDLMSCHTLEQVHELGEFWCRFDLHRRYDLVLDDLQHQLNKLSQGASYTSLLFSMAMIYRSVIVKYRSLGGDSLAIETLEALLYEVLEVLKDSEFLTIWQSLMLDELAYSDYSVDWYPQVLLE